jgi:hypothetical protein
LLTVPFLYLDLREGYGGLLGPLSQMYDYPRRFCAAV